MAQMEARMTGNVRMNGRTEISGSDWKMESNRRGGSWETKQRRPGIQICCTALGVESEAD